MIPLFILFLLASASTPARSQQNPATAFQQMSTADRLNKPGWWPRKSTYSRDDYTGPSKCVGCHQSLAEMQENSAMARTSSPASQSANLISFDLKSFKLGVFTYKIQVSAGHVSNSVTAGSETLSQPIGWAFGSDKVGQTYLFEKEGHFYETAFSYFSSLHEFAPTPGVNLLPLQDSIPQNLRKGAGRPLTKEQARGCFSCHNTAVETGGKFDLEHLIPNVTCEACHGPGANHVAIQKSGLETSGGLIFNPKNLSPVDSVEFCGSCHRTWWDVMLTEEVGVSTILAAPYRLVKSRCWGNGDARLTCIACHNPHQPLVREAGEYDRRCLSCHAIRGVPDTAKEHATASCPKGIDQCVTCHMPKYEVPDMHFRFTDHMIRVVKAEAPFPN
jgi:hypothetical protein